MITDIKSILEVILTLMVFSMLLYKENRLYRFAEYTFIGVSVGNIVVLALRSIYFASFVPLSKGEILYAVPIALGFLIYTRYSKSQGWMSRWAYGIIIGVGTAIAIKGVMHADVIEISKSVVVPLVYLGDIMKSLNAIVVFIGTISGILYFVFLRKSTKLWKYTSWIGRLFLLIFFAAIFGNTFLTRLGNLVARIDAILRAIGIIG